MNYADAITYLKENDIKKEDGTYYEFGEVRLTLRKPSTISDNRASCNPVIALPTCRKNLKYKLHFLAGYSRNAREKNDR